MNISVLGYPWTVTVLEKKEFNKRFKSCTAIMDTDTHEIFLRKDKLTHLHVVHELTHAFKHYCSVESFKFGEDGWEEFMCDFIGLHGETIVALAKTILKELN